MNSKESKPNSTNSKQPSEVGQPTDIYSQMVTRREQLLIQVSQCRIRECELAEQSRAVSMQQDQTSQQLVAIRGALAVLDEFLSKQKPLPNLEDMDADAESARV